MKIRLQMMVSYKKHNIFNHLFPILVGHFQREVNINNDIQSVFQVLNGGAGICVNHLSEAFLVRYTIYTKLSNEYANAQLILVLKTA